MKKYLGIVGALAFIFIIAWSFSGSKKKISLPKEHDIAKIEMFKNNATVRKKITDQAEISKWIRELTENTKKTRRDSVNDQPVNVKEYLKIQFHLKATQDNPSVVYLYDKGYGGQSYVEKPYEGIWKIKKEVADRINSAFSEE